MEKLNAVHRVMSLCTRTKKTFDMPGQKRTTPPTSDPLYMFYTSLLKQNKKSRMALVWCLHHGLLSKRKAEKVLLQLEMEKLAIN